jgi:hypothetical protein
MGVVIVSSGDGNDRANSCMSPPLPVLLLPLSNSSQSASNPPLPKQSAPPEFGHGNPPPPHPKARVDGLFWRWMSGYYVFSSSLLLSPLAAPNHFFFS